MSYKLIEVPVRALYSVLYVVLRKQQIVIILRPKEHLNFDIVNVAVQYIK